ncbi:hypothetical protein ACF0H5_006462 [Mactra antiquata]
MSPSAKRNLGGISVFIRNALFDIADIKQLFSTSNNPSMASYITDLSVDNRTESIHMPVYIELKGRTRRQIPTADVPPQEMSENFVKLMWNDTFKQQYIINMIESLDSIFSPFNEALDRNDVNSAVDILNSCFYQFGSIMQPRSDRPRPKPPFVSKPNRWFNQTCAFLRANVIQKLRYFRLTRSDLALQYYKTARNEFKSTCRSAKLELEHQERAKLTSAARSNNPKIFWNLLKNGSCPNRVNISVNEWFDYFKHLFNPLTNRESAQILIIN